MFRSSTQNPSKLPSAASRKGRVGLGLFLALLLCLPATSVLAAGSGGGGGGISAPSGTGKPKSPEHVASSNYKSGVRHKKRAWKLEEKAAKAKKEAKRDKLLAKAKAEYTKAKDKQALVLQIQPRNHEAANELGYALRKLGDYKRAVGAYNYALKIDPDFLQAIEYRGEAMLALGLFNETKEAYMRLFREDADLASQLMQAFQLWLENGPASRSPAEQEFADWVNERQKLVSFSTSPQGNPNLEKHW